MSYATTLLRCPFDYGALREKNPRLEILNPKGTCFTMSTLWAKELLDRPTREASDLAEILKERIMELAPIHETYIRETEATLDQKARNKGYVRVFDHFKVRSPTLRGGHDDHVPGINDEPDPAADWMGCPPGDMWGVAHKWITRERHNKPLAVLIGDDKHTVGAFVAKESTSVRLWDMNAGEFLISGMEQWKLWAKGFSDYEGGVKAVTLIDLERKV